MYEVTKYPHGTFSWVDCSTSDVGKAKPFYADLFGWTHEDSPMGDGLFYTMYKQDGLDVAGLGPMMQAQQEQGVPPHWMNYVSVDDVDAVAPKVTELGGKVIAPPMDVFENGRMMILQDPTGAMISLWQAKTHIGARLVNTTGAFIWNELTTRDAEAAMTFYGGLLGWEYQKMEDMEGYWVILNQGRMNGGIMQMTEQMGDMPPTWTVYFNVEDVKAATQKVKDIGGTVFMEMMDSPAGKFSVVADPSGAVMTIMQATQVDPWDV